MPRSIITPRMSEQDSNFDASCFSEDFNRSFFLSDKAPDIIAKQINLSFMLSRNVAFCFSMRPLLWEPNEVWLFAIEGLDLKKFIEPSYPHYNNIFFLCPPYSSNIFKYMFFTGTYSDKENENNACFYVKNSSDQYFSFQEREAIFMMNPL